MGNSKADEHLTCVFTAILKVHILRSAGCRCTVCMGRKGLGTFKISMRRSLCEFQIKTEWEAAHRVRLLPRTGQLAALLE